MSRIANAVLIIGLLATGSMLGCQNMREASKDIYTPEPEIFKVGMLLPGSISDQGWNALAHDGLKAIEAELGAEIDYVERFNACRLGSRFSRLRYGGL